jgi:uncharacterized membrane protein
MAYKNKEDREAFLKRWRTKNRDKLLEQGRKRYQKNKNSPILKNRRKIYYLKNKERIIARHKEYILRNPDYMKNYELSRSRNPKGRLKRMFTGINKRINHKHSYRNRKLYFTYKEFLEHFLEDVQFKVIFGKWVESGHQYPLCPSLDRIDNSGDYTLENVQIISLSENSSKAGRLI